MEDDEDDFYGGAGQKTEAENGDGESTTLPIHSGSEVKAEQAEESDDEEEDSDDDIQITTERPEGVKSESVPPPRAASSKPTLTHDRPTSPTTSQQPPTKIAKTSPDATGTPSPQTTLTHAGKEGKDFPSIRTSSLNLTANPTWPSAGKPLSHLDIDADLAEHSKPWRLPGTDQTDFFNYGFDEYTWTQYALRQQEMAGTVGQIKEQDAQMKAMLGMSEPGGAGAGGGVGVGGGGGMPPMPDMNTMMAMMNSGVDPSKMDMNQFMAMMNGQGGPSGTPAQGGGFGGQSPFPPSGPQGFQPPTGPGGGGQGGFGDGVNMDGYSSQQLAIMQGQQGGGGGRGRGRRGRGYY